MLLCALLLQWDMNWLGTDSFGGETSVPFYPIIVLVMMVMTVVLVAKTTKLRLLSRAEVLCVLYAMLIAMPLMTQGFWHRFASITRTMPYDAQFSLLTAYSDKLWPHGKNLLEEGFVLDDALWEDNGSVSYEMVEIEPGEEAPGLVMSNESADQVSSARMTIPVTNDKGKAVITPGESFFISLLARPGADPDFELPSENSRYFVRLHYSDSNVPFEVFSSNAKGERTVIHPTGFLRVGNEAFAIPLAVDQEVTIEIGLEGEGVVSFADPKFFSVEGLAALMKGQRIVTQSEFDALPSHARAGLVVKPDNMFSFAGAKFLVTGYIPWDQWATPILYWGGLFTLILMATMAICVLLRRQWMDNERYPMPLTRIPLALMGEQPESEQPKYGLLPRVYRNPLMWTGLVLGLLYTLWRAVSFYITSIPDPSIEVPLKPYFMDPAYGQMWEITFSVSLIFLSIAMFMELGMLMSIVVGFFIFRSMYWLGESTGMKQMQGYPFPEAQQLGGYLTYALLILLFSRRYIWRVIKASCMRDKEAWKGEMLSYPGAIGLLALCLVLSLVWASLVGVDLMAMGMLFVFLMAVALIAIKIRTEAGIPFSYFGVHNIAVVFVLIGGISVLGPEALLFVTVLGFLIGPTPFFAIPGAQMELADLGRRFKVRPYHLVVTTVLGIVGGLVIGGWVFLSHSYGVGGENMGYIWGYDQKGWWFTNLSTQISTANIEINNPGQGSAAGSDQYLGYAIGGGLTGGVAILRQFFAGMWLHPIGILLGSNFLAGLIWGSCLTAWIIRSLALKFGGASTVRERLQPLFVGVFLGTICAHLLHAIYATMLKGQGIEEYFRWNLFLLP